MQFGTALKPIKKSFHDKSAWAKYRSGIGSSEVASVLGLNPYQSPYQLWLVKTKREPEAEMNDYMFAGIHLEQAVAKFWERKTDRKVIKSSAENTIYIHPEKPFLRVSPDRFYWTGGVHNEQNKGILECKTTQKEIDVVPESWFCQIQYQLGICQKETGSLGWLKSGINFDHQDIEFVPDFFQWMIESVEKFWIDNMLADKEPEITTVADVMKKFDRHTEGKSLEIGHELYDTYLDIKNLREDISEKEKRKAELEDRIKMVFTDNEYLTYHGKVLMTWKAPKASERFDTVLFKKEHPDLYSQFTKTSESTRRFVIK